MCQGHVHICACLILALAALIGGVTVSSAQDYPTRPVTLVVPQAPGGPGDVVARIMAETMRASLGQPIIIENIVGAGGSIGVSRVARAAPDGYTIVLGNWGSHVVNGVTYDLKYNLIDSFTPISLIAENYQLIVGRKSLPPRDLSTLIEWLRANRDKATQGISGWGAPSHVFGLFLQKTIGVQLQLIPFRGAAPAMQGLVGEQVDLLIDNTANSLPLVESQQIRALAVTSLKRLPSAPQIPTADESGLPGFSTSNWYGYWAPAQTPSQIVSKLNQAITHSLADTTVRKRLSDLGWEIVAAERQTPEALHRHHKAELEKWWPILRAANIKAP